MKSPLQLAIASELHKYHLVEQEAHEVERFRHRGGLISYVSHGEMLEMVDVLS